MRVGADNSVATKTSVTEGTGSSPLSHLRVQTEREGEKGFILLEKLLMSRTRLNPLWVKYNLILHCT